jgi:hypothetical protein
MFRKFFLAIISLPVFILAPIVANAQSSFEIRYEFLKKELANNREVDTVCRNLEIGGGTGWLFIELKLSSYISSFQRYTTGFSGKDILDWVYVDCGPYYLPDLFRSWSVIEWDPKSPVEGQPMKYTFKVKLGDNLKPFVMKICRGPLGYWQGLDKFIQMAQAIELKAAWVPGDKEPANPLIAPEAPIDLTGVWAGYSAQGEDLGANQVTQEGKSITFVHPNGQVTRGGYIVDENSIYVPVWGSKGIINSSRTRIDFQGGSLNGIYLVRK